MVLIVKRDLIWTGVRFDYTVNWFSDSELGSFTVVSAHKDPGLHSYSIKWFSVISILLIKVCCGHNSSWCLVWVIQLLACREVVVRQHESQLHI